MLKSQELVDYMQQNQHLKFEITMKRNFHPYMSSTYINGYVKDQPLRNYTSEEIIDWFKRDKPDDWRTRD